MNGGGAVATDRDEHEAMALPELRQAIAARWPALTIDGPALEAALSALGDERGPVQLDTACTVALALACARGDRWALRTFEDLYFGPARRAVYEVVGERDLDEVLQRLRERMFMSVDGGPARVVQAAGRGDMSTFVRVAALRLALNTRRDDDRRRRRHEDADVQRLSPALDDPELRVMKTTHVEALKQAFEQAAASLTSRQRGLLRHHLIDHLSIDQLGRRYGVHRATAARWLARARAEVAERTRARLAELVDPGTSGEELQQLVRSRLDLSMTRVLAQTRTSDGSGDDPAGG